VISRNKNKKLDCPIQLPLTKLSQGLAKSPREEEGLLAPGVKRIQLRHAGKTSSNNGMTLRDRLIKSRVIRTLPIVWIVGALILALAAPDFGDVKRGATLSQTQVHAEISRPRAGPRISIDDVDLFYRVYDAAHGRPTADDLQHDYLDRGSEGLLEFAKLRHISGSTIAQNLTNHPEVYSNARRCADVLPRARERLKVALRNLADLYPEAKFPAVTVAVGHGKPVGVGSPATGVQIGLEALCAVTWMNANLEDRFVYVIAHEYAHVQQVRALVDDDHPTVLEASLIEGAAEFTAELIAGDIAYPFKRSPIEKSKLNEIEAAFVADEDKTDLSPWLNNGTIDKPGDLGYWVGYRIVKSYYQRTANKRAALRQILQMSDPKEFVAKSGWSPGIQLQ
jgi:hypothetical protein